MSTFVMIEDDECVGEGTGGSSDLCKFGCVKVKIEEGEFHGGLDGRSVKKHRASSPSLQRGVERRCNRLGFGGKISGVALRRSRRKNAGDDSSLCELRVSSEDEDDSHDEDGGVDALYDGSDVKSHESDTPSSSDFLKWDDDVEEVQDSKNSVKVDDLSREDKKNGKKQENEEVVMIEQRLLCAFCY